MRFHILFKEKEKSAFLQKNYQLIFEKKI